MFNNIPVFVDPAARDGEILLSEFKVGRHLVSPPPTDEEAQVRAVANRLLGTTGALTLEIMQEAIDRFTAAHHTDPDTIIMSPATRREYLKLLEPDRRYTNSPFTGCEG